MKSATTLDWNPDILAAPPESEAAVGSTIKPLNLWRPSQFLQYTEPPGSHLLLPAYVSLGELTAVIGQGGVGKSRLAGLWLPICQITGREWCGLQTSGDPQKWIVFGDENGLSRIKTDLTRILGNLTSGERAMLDEFLRIQAICGYGDSDLNLGDVDTRARIRATIEAESPGGIIIDPLGNFAPGDISKPHEMKEALRLIIATIRAVAPGAAIILLHHARTGRSNIAQGVGWDAANFATGGKTLYAAARCVMNLMPGDKDDDTRLVLSCAKPGSCRRVGSGQRGHRLAWLEM